MNVGNILCINTAAKNDNNTVIQCPISPTCSQKAMLKEQKNVQLKSVEIDFDNLEQKYNCDY